MFFILFFVRFYHCTVYTVSFHCLYVRFLRVTLNINQLINKLPQWGPAEPGRQTYFSAFWALYIHLYSPVYII